MSDDPTGIVAFLTARLDEEAQRAREAELADDPYLDWYRANDEIAVKRKHLDMYQQNRLRLRAALDALNASAGEEAAKRASHAWAEECGYQGAIENVLYLDATAYTDHSDFKEDWKP